MYKEFYQLEKEAFSILPDPKFLYFGNKHKTAYTMLEYALLNSAGFAVITGEIGSGKTTLLRHLLNTIDDEITVGLISNTHLAFGSLLQWILSAFSLDHKGKDKVEHYEKFVEFALGEYARGKRVVLIIDEAQNMQSQTLEELRVISNINSDDNQIIQVIIVGQPELKETLCLPELRQFAQRVIVDYHLESLDSVDIDAYISHRLTVAGAKRPIFAAEAVDLIKEYSGGIPRTINILCDTALVYGFGNDQEIIGPDIMQEVINDKLKGGIMPIKKKCLAMSLASSV